MAAINAPVLECLLPPASESEIQVLAQETGLSIPSSLRAFWQRVGGIQQGLTYHNAAFAGYLFAPVSVQESLEDFRLAEQLRRENPMEDQEFADQFWPAGMIKFAGEDSNGFWVNCRPESPTFESVYVRFVNSDPLLRWSTNINALFKTLCAAVAEGTIRVAGETDADWDAGSLATDETALDVLAKKMNPGCAAHDDESAVHAIPDWN
ncbi:SMI1/KNR4 family protein [Aliiroseovarius halocynthiae]|uniref:SMI1/KNR4 family protein n=1 Tax=Aliiroseovarius halocynthiae TaxID=985055 RepID=UPI00163D959F|nr:SMI1/KNR4 family protein [Aliiroseovarius halocynthiae]